ncbi:hypothetical protein [Lactobacillus delbrueckii]
MSYLTYGWSAYKPALLIEMFIACIISSIVFDAVLVKLITQLFDRVMAK